MIACNYGIFAILGIDIKGILKAMRFDKCGKFIDCFGVNVLSGIAGKFDKGRNGKIDDFEFIGVNFIMYVLS